MFLIFIFRSLTKILLRIFSMFYNIHTLSENTKFIDSLQNRTENLVKGSLFYRCLKLMQINLIFSHSVCILSINMLNILNNILVRERNMKKTMLILLPFFTIAQHESGTRKTVSWLVTALNKIESS
jgi:hypothetical protein